MPAARAQRLRMHIIHICICAQLHRTNSRSHPVMLSHFALRGVRRRIIYLYRSADAMRKIMGNNVCAAHHEPRNTTGYMRARIYICESVYMDTQKGLKRTWYFPLCGCLFPDRNVSARSVCVRQLTILRFWARGDLFCAPLIVSICCAPFLIHQEAQAAAHHVSSGKLWLLKLRRMMIIIIACVCSSARSHSLWRLTHSLTVAQN